MAAASGVRWGKDAPSIVCRASSVAETVKHLPAMQETQVRSLGQEDPLEEGMATHSSILAWRILWTEEPGVLQSKESNMTEATEHAHTVRLKMHIRVI